MIDWAEVDALTVRSRERAEEAEDQRGLADVVIDEAAAAGILDLVTPSTHGGGAGSIADLGELARRLAHGCTSTAWTLSFLSMHNWLLARFPAAIHDELWADRSYVLAPAPLAPGGSAAVVDGGLKVSGTWEWATGVMHADWVIVHVLVDPATFDLRFAAIPVDQVKVLDVWHTAGMRGTGSNTVVIDDVFVPDHRLVASADFMAGVEVDAASEYPLGGYPVIPVLALVASAPALGAAERCVELVTDRMRDRVLAYSLGDRQADSSAARVRLAAALASVTAARAVWDTALQSLDDAVAAGQAGDVELRARWRMSATTVVDMCRRAIDELSVGAGASVYFEDHPLQRYQRDVNTLKGHAIFDWDRTMDLVGTIALGVDPGPGAML
ncbi:MAG: acyl-CoA dehydrogenase family protein [Acidimicrobiales bacterium]